MNISLCAFAPENLVSRDGVGRPVPRQPAHIHVVVVVVVVVSHIQRIGYQPEKNYFTVANTQAESGAYLQGSSRVPRRRRPLFILKPPYAIGRVPSLSGHAIAYRWRSLPRVRRHRASKSQGSFERMLPWQVTMNQLNNMRLSLPHPLLV